MVTYYFLSVTYSSLSFKLLVIVGTVERLTEMVLMSFILFLLRFEWIVFYNYQRGKITVSVNGVWWLWGEHINCMFCTLIIRIIAQIPVDFIYYILYSLQRRSHSITPEKGRVMQSNLSLEWMPVVTIPTEHKSQMLLGFLFRRTGA